MAGIDGNIEKADRRWRRSVSSGLRIAELLKWHSRDRSALDIFRNEVIRVFDFTSFATAIHTVLLAKILYSQIPRIDFCMSVTRTEAVILGWEAP